MCRGLFWAMGNRWWRPSHWHDGAYILAGLDKNLEDKFKKIISSGNKSKKESWQEDTGTAGLLLYVGVGEPFWGGDIWAETCGKWGRELLSGWGSGQCSGWGRTPPALIQEQQGQVADMAWGDRRKNGRERGEMGQGWVVESSRALDEVLELDSARQLHVKYLI